MSTAGDTDDVLYQNLDFLAFDIDDFNGATVGGEFLVGLGDFVEAGVGAGFYQRTVSRASTPTSSIATGRRSSRT